MVSCQLCRHSFPFEVLDYDGVPVQYWTCPTCIIATADRPIDCQTPTMRRRLAEEPASLMRARPSKVGRRH
jgi:hypothetical protein